MNAFIRLLYALLVGLAAAAFIGVAIFSLYQPPKAPAFPNYGDNESEQQYNQEQRAYDQADKLYQKKEKTYQRNVTMLLLPLTAMMVIGGAYLFNRGGVIGEGLSLGAVITSIYAIITASLGDSNVLRFLAVCLLLISVLSTAYFKFGKATNHN